MKRLTRFGVAEQRFALVHAGGLRFHKRSQCDLTVADANSQLVGDGRVGVGEHKAHFWEHCFNALQFLMNDAQDAAPEQVGRQFFDQPRALQMAGGRQPVLR